MRKNSCANISVSQRNKTTLALLENSCKMLIDATDYYFVQFLLIFPSLVRLKRRFFSNVLFLSFLINTEQLLMSLVRGL